MKRKMLPEEKELMDFIKRECAHWHHAHLRRLITSLVRAVREECAKVAEDWYTSPQNEDDHDAFLQCKIVGEIAAAIRRGNDL